MGKNLLIVESPTKAKTIKKYLGPDFEIMASVGHLKDLPVNKLGVDLDRDFQPEYATVKGKAKILKALKEAGKKAQAIYLAPDPDREGEAIAWHIADELKNGERKIFRVLFNELTPKAIREAVSEPQSLNQEKFESQQARRILDRLVGYQISPLLWSRVRRGLSAGRVQSVALKMICDREREIYAFEPEEYWSLTAHLEAQEPPPFKARFLRYEGKKHDLKTEEQTLKIISEVEGVPFRVSAVSKRKTKKNPLPPFITSLLQQEGYKKLGFPAKKTMFIAQNLYEGVELGPKGQVGLITYMRTDSFRLSNDAVAEARDYIGRTFGSDYLPSKPNRFKSPRGAQEAHEAIRPTSTDLNPETVSTYLTKDQLSLYSLIWKRFVASQMSPAMVEQTQADIEAGKATFRASGSVVTFKGFTALYDEGPTNGESEKDHETHLPPLKQGQDLTLLKLDPSQHFTQPPPRFTEATLIKALEENGIGRPSTYAAILSNINEKEYVSLEKRRFKPTELGFLITDLLVKNFPEILDTKFTAQMEENLDKIERGEVKWTNLLKRFYGSFQKDLERAGREMKGEVPVDLACPKCGRPMAIKSGKNGLFLACTGYPECKNTANFTRGEKGNILVEKVPEIEQTEATCDICGRPMVVKKGKFGPFLACSGYPECKYTRALQPEGGQNTEGKDAGVACKACGGRMLLKLNRSGQRFLACENYPRCTQTESFSTRVPCPSEGCHGTLVERVSKRGRKFYACNQYPKCRFMTWDEPFDAACPQCGTPVLTVKRPKGGDPVLVCRKKGCGFTKPLASASDQ
jgi:DNA topoisomerase-1